MHGPELAPSWGIITIVLPVQVLRDMGIGVAIAASVVFTALAAIVAWVILPRTASAS